MKRQALAGMILQSGCLGSVTEYAKRFFLWALVLTVPLPGMLLAGDPAAAKSFLRSGDHLVFIGDSLTEMGQYVRMLDGVVQQAYPDAGIKVVNQGSGGKGADAAVPLLAAYLVDHKPSLVLMMFGVNDTQWNERDAGTKAETFVSNLKKMHEFCVAQGLPLILLKESPFSHNLSDNPWVAGVNGTLDAILAAQEDYASAYNIPVIDGYGHYRKQLAAAWAKNPNYEFTPDVVHPISPGSAALSSALIHALGIGLALSGDPRGELIHSQDAGVAIEIVDEVSVMGAGDEINCQVKVQNLSRVIVEGRLSLLSSFSKPVTVACSLPPLGSQMVTIPVARPARDTVSPLFARFEAGAQSDSRDTLIFVAKQQSLAEAPARFTSKDFPLFIHQEGYRKQSPFQKSPHPVKTLTVVADQQAIHLNFNWDDPTPVLAEETTTSRVGKEVNAPVDVLARAGAQKCDAIDFLLDLRSRQETGRPTADTDGVPDGVIKIVVFRQTTGAGFRCYPENMKDRISIKETGKDIELKLTTPAPVAEFSLMAFINDSFSEEDNNTACFILGDGWPGDPMRNLRFSTDKADTIFYRVGY